MDSNRFQLIDESNTARIQRAQTLLDVANQCRPSPESTLFALGAGARRYGGNGVETIAERLREMAEEDLRDIDGAQAEALMERLVEDPPPIARDGAKTYPEMTIAELRHEIATRDLPAPNARATHRDIERVLEQDDAARIATGESFEG